MYRMLPFCLIKEKRKKKKESFFKGFVIPSWKSFNDRINSPIPVFRGIKL